MKALNLSVNILVAVLGIALGIAIIGITGYWAVSGIIAFFTNGVAAICDAIAGLCWLFIEAVVVIRLIVITVKSI